MRILPLQHALLWHSWLIAGICGILATLWPLPAVSLALLVLLMDKRLWHWQRLLVTLLTFAAPMTFCHIALRDAEENIASAPQWLDGKNRRICGTICSVQGLPQKRLRILLENAAPAGEAPLPGVCAWTWEKPAFQPMGGQQVCITRAVKPVSSFANGEDDGYLFSLFAQKIYWRIWSDGEKGNPETSGSPTLSARLRAFLHKAFLNALRDGKNPEQPLPQDRAILPALLFGDRQYLDIATTDDFASATLAHSLALSGQHLGIATLAGMLLILAASRANPEIYLARPRRLLVLAASLPPALLYLWIGNSPASLERAAAMLGFTALWIWLGRPFSGQDLLCSALLLILALNPLAAFDAGLQLSALCVGAILISWPALAAIFDKIPGSLSWSARLCKRIALILAVSLIIQLSLLPVSLARFQIAGCWFPLNLVWLPALALVVLPGAFTGLLLAIIPLDVCQHAASLALNLAALPCHLLLRLLGFLRENGLLEEPVFMRPHWSAIVAFALLCASLAWLFGNPASGRLLRKSSRLLAASLALLAIAPVARIIACLEQRPAIDALDTGQSQAVYVTLPNAIRILVDGGGSYSGRFDPGRRIVAPLLTANRAPGADVVINSHPDLDHLGGLFYIIEHLPVGAVFHNGREAGGNAGDKWRQLRQRVKAATLKAGDKIILGRENYCLEVLHPPGNAQAEGNAASLILRLVQNGTGLALFPGDAEKDNLRAINHAAAKVVLAPHHGSDRNLSPEFYLNAAPEAVIACCGYLNRWHYPGRKTRNWLAGHGITLLDTGTHGRIRIVFTEDGELEIKTARQNRQLRKAPEL